MQNTNKRVDKSQFIYTETEKRPAPLEYVEIVDYVKAKCKSWAGDRQPLEEDWKAAWAEYFSNSRSAEIIRQEAVLQIGDVQTDWRHKIPTGKAFELVEDANSYLQDAFFPNKQWFDLYPKHPIQDPEWEELLSVTQKYIQHKLDDANFQDWWDVNVRQALIVGTSALALPWRYETKTSKKNRVVTASDGDRKVVQREETQIVKNGLDLQVIDMFDFYLDPYALDSNNANCVRKMYKTKAEIINLVKNGTYPLASVNDIYELNKEGSSDNSHSTTQKTDKHWMNGTTQSEYDPNEKLVVYEYWGDIITKGCTFFDVCATIVDGILLDFQANPFWGGKPFVITTLVPLQDSPYGLGLLSPILGQLHQMFVTQNHRLDCSELVINPMWLVVNDGTLDMDDLYSQPAKIIQVGALDNIQQLQFNTSSLGVSVQDEQLLEQRIERVTGINPYIGQGMGRDAERVTAEEVQSKREAGGTRLGRYHKHIETNALSTLLKKAYSYMQQFVVDDETIRVNKEIQGSTRGGYEFITVGAEELENEMDIVPVGSDWVIDKEREIRERIDFITLVSQHPDMSQMMNWEEVLKDLARRLVKQDWEKYLSLNGQQQVIPEEMGANTLPEEGTSPEVMPQEQALPPAQPASTVPLEQRLAEGMPPDVQQSLAQAVGDPQKLAQLLQAGNL